MFFFVAVGLGTFSQALEIPELCWSATMSKASPKSPKSPKARAAASTFHLSNPGIACTAAFSTLRQISTTLPFRLTPCKLVQARGQSHKGTFSLTKDTEKVIDLGNQLQVHVERINNNVGRLYFVATNQMPKAIRVREPNADRQAL